MIRVTNTVCTIKRAKTHKKASSILAEDYLINEM